MVYAPVWRDNPRALAVSHLSRMITSSVDLAYYGVSHAKDWVWIVVNEAVDIHI